MGCYCDLVDTVSFIECTCREELGKTEGESIRKYKTDNEYIVVNEI